MEEGSPIWGLAVFGLLVALLAIVNGFGAAIQNLNGSELEKRAEEGEKKAKKLYISAHSAVESQAFYKAMGCVEAEEYNAEHVEKEPYDCQLECDV